MSSWVVNGIEHLNQQWFWIGDGGSEASIDTLTLNSAATSDDDFDPGDETALLSYSGTGYDLNITIILTGSNGQPSNIGEAIEIINTSSTQALNLRFYEYNDFELGGTQDDALAWVIDPPSDTAKQNDVGGFFITESAVTPVPDHFEVNTDGNTLASLNDGVATTLSEVAGPVGPGDLTWAFQWDFVIPAGGSSVLSKNKSLTIPVPAALPLGLAGLAMVTRRRR